MEHDDFGDLYTDVEPPRQNESISRGGVSLQAADQLMYNGYDEDEDEAFLYTSLENSVSSAPKSSILSTTARASASKTFELFERDSEELLLYGLLDEGSYEDARKDEHSLRVETRYSSKGETQCSLDIETQHSLDVEIQQFAQDEFPTLHAVKAFKETKTEHETLHDHIQPEDELENFDKLLKIESFSGADNVMTVQDNEELKNGINDEEEGELGAEITPPGLSIGANLSELPADVGQDWTLKDVQGFATEAVGYNDVDSESEDDLQILLNDDNQLYAGSERTLDRVVEGSEDEDEEDLVIVASNEPPDDGEWVEDQMQPLDVSLPVSSGGAVVPGVVAGAPGDERGQGMKANLGAGGNISALRLGYSGKPYHPQPHYSQFKYVRPGLAPAGAQNSATASSAQAVVQVPKMQSGAAAWASGRGVGGPSMSGRGDWGGAGRSASGSQRPMLGAGMSYGHSARGFQYGMEFSLPPSKSVFDIDLDAFEDKPWRHPSTDITDYFNFSFNENTWKQYCTQLAQVRLEATMQSKIRVYVSGRSDQDYDPDLPPELRAAAGGHEASGEINHLQTRMQDNGHHFSGGRGQGAGRGRGIFPIGRAIQVEGGGADRIPSSDLKRQRARDSDAVIQIVLHDPDAEEENEEQDVADENSAPALSMKQDEDYEDTDEGKKPANFEQEGHIQKSGYSNEEGDPVLNDWERNSPSLVSGMISNMAPHGHNGLAVGSSMGVEGQRKYHSGLGRPGDQHLDHIQDYAILPGPPPPLSRGGIGRPIYGGARSGMPLPGLLPSTGMSDGMRPILPRVDYGESARQRAPRMLTPPHRLPSQGRVHDSDDEHSNRARSASKEQNISQQDWHPQRNKKPVLKDAEDQEFEPDTDVPNHEVLDQRKRCLSEDNHDDEGLDSHSEDRKLQQKRQKILTSMDDRSRSGSASVKVPKASESETSKDASKSVEQSIEEESSVFLLKEKLSAKAAQSIDELEQDICVKEWEPSKSRSYRSGSDNRVMRQERGLRKEGRKEEWSEVRPFRQGEESMVRSATAKQMMDRRGMIEQDRRSQRRDEESLSKKKEDEQKRRDHLEEQWHRREREREREKEREQREREKERERERERERGRERERERDDVQFKERRDIPKERERDRDDMQLKERRDIQRRKAVEEDMYRRHRKEDESARDPERERVVLSKERRDLQRRKTEEEIYHRQRKEEENVRDGKIRHHNDTKFWPAYGRDDNRIRHDIRTVGTRDDYSKDRHRNENQRLKSREKSDQLREGDVRTRQFDVRSEPVNEDHKVHRDRNSGHDGTMNVRKGYQDRHVEPPSPHTERHTWPANLIKGGEQGRNGSRSTMSEYTSKHPSGSKKLKVEDYQRNEVNDKAYTRMRDDKGADMSRPGRMDKRTLGEKRPHGVARRLKADITAAHFLLKHEDYPQNRSTSFDDDDEDRRKGRSKLERWTSRKEKGYLPSKVTRKEDKKVSDAVDDSGAHIDDGHREEMALSIKSHRGDRKRDRSQEDQSQFSETAEKDAKEKHHVLLPYASNLQEQEEHLKEDGREDLASEAPDNPSAKFTNKEDAEEHLKDRQQRQSEMAASLARRKERFRLQAKNDSDAERKHSQSDEEVERKQQNRQSDVIEEVKQERPARKRRWGGA